MVDDDEDEFEEIAAKKQHQHQQEKPRKGIREEGYDSPLPVFTGFVREVFLKYVKFVQSNARKLQQNYAHWANDQALLEDAFRSKPQVRREFYVFQQLKSFGGVIETYHCASLLTLAKMNPTWAQLSYIYDGILLPACNGHQTRQTTRYEMRTIVATVAAVANVFGFDTQKRFEYQFTDMPEVTMMVDATAMTCQSNSGCFNGHYKRKIYKIMAVTDCIGRFVTTNLVSSNNADAPQFCVIGTPGEFTNATELVLSDKGFLGCKRVIHPYKGSEILKNPPKDAPNRDVLINQFAFNKYCAIVRAKIEQTFGILSHFDMTRGCRLRRSFAYEVWCAVAQAVNLELERRYQDTELGLPRFVSRRIEPFQFQNKVSVVLQRVINWAGEQGAGAFAGKRSAKRANDVELFDPEQLKDSERTDPDDQLLFPRPQNPNAPQQKLGVNSENASWMRFPEMRQKLLELNDEYIQIDSALKCRLRAKNNKKNKQHNYDPFDKFITIPFNEFYADFRESNPALPNKNFKGGNLRMQIREAKVQESIMLVILEKEEQRLKQVIEETSKSVSEKDKARLEKQFVEEKKKKIEAQMKVRNAVYLSNATGKSRTEQNDDDSDTDVDESDDESSSDDDDFDEIMALGTKSSPRAAANKAAPKPKPKQAATRAPKRMTKKERLAAEVDACRRFLSQVTHGKIGTQMNQATCFRNVNFFLDDLEDDNKFKVMMRQNSTAMQAVTEKLKVYETQKMLQYLIGLERAYSKRETALLTNEVPKQKVGPKKAQGMQTQRRDRGDDDAGKMMMQTDK